MKEILDWLIKMESFAARVYEKASNHFPDDKEFTEFLKQLAVDEGVHHIVIKRAAGLIEAKGGMGTPVVDFDPDIQRNIESHLLLTEKRIDANSLTKEGMMECLVYSEFSEWNDIFLYVINTLKHQDSEFIKVAVKIQKHKKYIEGFIESRSELRKYLGNIKVLPRLWEEKILVVDDEEMIVDVLSAIFADEGVIDSASNGKEALEKTIGKYYAAIVTDVDMPVMNGIEFYKEAVDKYPDIKERFLFFTGSPDEWKISFFKERNLRYLIKPAPINKIKEMLADILKNAGSGHDSPH